MADFLKDGFALSLVLIGFVAGAIFHAGVYIWRQTIPDDLPAKADEKYAASIEHFPAVYVTFLIALLGIVASVSLAVGWM